jgi:hypothetical protein
MAPLTTDAHGGTSQFSEQTKSLDALDLTMRTCLLSAHFNTQFALNSRLQQK